jgi:dsRNA-specific ribonuclease
MNKISKPTTITTMDNPQNRLITKEEVENILNYFGGIEDNNQMLKINNLEPFQRSFIHESYYQTINNAISNGLPIEKEKMYLNYIPVESNERLEYLGDHILKAVMGRYLHERFGEEREGFLTKLKIKIEKCSMLHRIGVTLGFKQFLLLSLQVENQTLLDIDRGRNTPSYYEDAFEAFIGAIVLEFGERGYIYADRFVRAVIENIIDFAEINSKNDNFKDALQRYFQSIKWRTPVYTSLNEEGPLYRKVFTRIMVITQDQYRYFDTTTQTKIKLCTDTLLLEYKFTNSEIFKKLYELIETGNYILGIGYGRKVTNAEQECAKNCLETLGIDLNY